MQTTTRELARESRVPEWLRSPEGTTESQANSISTYEAPPSHIPGDSRRLLEQYGGIPPGKVLEHIIDFRDRLWDINPLPCIGQFKFVQPTLTRQPSYPRIVDALQRGGRYLDIGPAAGQDMRSLVLDDCPSSNMYAIEKTEGYVDAAYDLWRDRETLQTRFVVGDLFDETLGAAQALVDTVDVVHAGLLLHLFELERQTEACVRLCEFLRPTPGALIVGSSVGRRTPGFFRGPNGERLFKHNMESFKDMWNDVGKRTGLRCRVSGWEEDVKSLNGKPGHWKDPLTTLLFWEVEREKIHGWNDA